MYRESMAFSPSVTSRSSIAWALTCLAAEICSEKKVVITFRLSYRRSIIWYCRWPTSANTSTAMGSNSSIYSESVPSKRYISQQQRKKLYRDTMVLNAIWTTRLAWVMSLTRPEIRAEGWRRSTSRMGRWRILRQSSLRARSVTRALPYPPVRLMSMLSRALKTFISA